MNKYLKILEKIGSIKKGHFLLSSGFHSDTYIQCALLFQYPEYTELFAKKLAQKFKKNKVDVVISPAVGGIILGYEIAKNLNARAIFAERVKNQLVLRRSFSLKKNENVLIVEDVITTGKSVDEIVSICKKNSANILGLSAVVERAEKKFPFPKYVLIKLNLKKYYPQKCYLCKKNIQIEKPGGLK